MAARQLTHFAGRSSSVSRLEPAGAKRITLTETEYRSMMARMAAQEDRLDRMSIAFGALCELISDSTGLTEHDLLARIERSSVTVQSVANS